MIEILSFVLKMLFIVSSQAKLESCLALGMKFYPRPGVVQHNSFNRELFAFQILSGPNFVSVPILRESHRSLRDGSL